MTATLCQLIHGEPGVGKSWYAQTTPAPRLVLDAEGGSRVPWRMRPNNVAEKQRLVKWNPAREEPPAPGDWEVCYVAVQDFQVMSQAYAWLNAGKHPFRSVVIDSLTEVQKRCRDQLGGNDTLTERNWGDLLIKMENLVRYYRDLTFHPTHPLDTVTFIALTDPRSGRSKPAIQGGLSISLPGYVDLEGYLYTEMEDEVNTRKLLINPVGNFQAKDRTHLLTARYGPAIPNPDCEQMLAVLNDDGEANG